ncbi:MAG: ScpA family protein [Cyclonatronaceae bacterium]
MYRVELQNFEGPLDLLLFFIKRDELDIYDIPISYITRQFLDYIHFLDELDLEVASEFILMAGTLMSIKARLLLPRDEPDEGDLDESDPRYELVQSLLEYKRYKEIAEEMHMLDHKTRERYYRKYLKPDVIRQKPDTEPLRDVTLYDLMAAYKHVLARLKEQPPVHHVEKVKVTVEQQSKAILTWMRDKGKVAFIDLCREVGSRPLLVITFLAILEMVKEGQLNLFMKDDYFQFYLEIPSVSRDEIMGKLN